MSCSCNSTPKQVDTREALPVVLKSRFSSDFIKWASTFADHRQKINSARGNISYKVKNAGDKRNLAKGKIVSAIAGDSFYTDSKRAYERLLIGEREAKDYGIKKENLKGVTFHNILSYDGKQTYQYANANNKGHIFLGEHVMTKDRFGIDSLLFRDPYRQFFWDELFLSDGIMQGGNHIPVTPIMTTDLEKIKGDRCLRIEMQLGSPTDHSLLRIWFNMQKGGLPVQFEHFMIRPGYKPLLLEKIIDVQLESIHNDIYFPVALKRVAYAFTQNASVLTEQITAYTYHDISVNDKLTTDQFAHVLPKDVYCWSEATGKVTDGASVSDYKVPVGKKVHLKDFRCSNTRVNCSTSPCSSGPTRPLNCLICSGGVVIVPCIERIGTYCDGTTVSCGTFLRGNCNLFGTCSNTVDTGAVCIVFDC